MDDLLIILPSLVAGIAGFCLSMMGAARAMWPRVHEFAIEASDKVDAELEMVRGALQDAEALPDMHPDRDILVSCLTERVEQLEKVKAPLWPNLEAPFTGAFAKGAGERREMSKEPEPHTRLNPPIHLTPPDSQMESCTTKFENCTYQTTVLWPIDKLPI